MKRRRWRLNFGPSEVWLTRALFAASAILAGVAAGTWLARFISAG